MKKVLLLLLIGCADTTPSTGEYYQCEGIFMCDGRYYRAGAMGCADSKEEADILAYEDLERDHTAGCAVWSIQISCKSTGEFCVYKESDGD